MIATSVRVGVTGPGYYSFDVWCRNVCERIGWALAVLKTYWMWQNEICSDLRLSVRFSIGSKFRGLPVTASL